MNILISFAFWLPVLASANTVIKKTECSPSERMILSHPEFLKSVGNSGKLMASDCATLPEGKMGVVLILNASSGVESYFIVFERRGFTVASKPVFVSPALGFDTFPVQVGQDRRLLFVKPDRDHSKLVTLYMNIQTGPSATRLGRYELDLSSLKLSEDPRKFWMIEAGRVPKIVRQKNDWQVEIEKKTFNL